MGKKSKRKSSSGETKSGKASAMVTDEEYQQSPTTLEDSPSSNKRSTPKSSNVKDIKLEETLENLHFEDPFEDEFEEEVLLEEDGDVDGDEGRGKEVDDEEDDQQANNNNTTPVVQSWTPFGSTSAAAAGESEEELEIDESAYTMHHAVTPEWPSLSFCFLRDTLGDSRTRFPHSLVCAVGTQADKRDRNKLTVMKLSDLSKTNRHHKNDDDELEEEDDEEEDEEEDDMVDLDPIVEHVSFPHCGGVNRVRAMPQHPHIVATWSDVGHVYLYNVQQALDTFCRSAGQVVAGGPSNNNNHNNNSKSPFFTYQGHSTEGFAMDWSPVVTGQFATGDCDGAVHLWNPAQDTIIDYQRPSTSSFVITANAYTCQHNTSVEDIQWSPTEATVLATANTGGNVCIYDTRRHDRPMLTHQATATDNNNNVDVNVIAWNHNVTNLLASGADDGVLCVWDLRTFSSSPEQKPKPLARFTCHQTPITSLEWHPTDESMLLVSDDVGAYVYDLSIEEEEEEKQDKAETTATDPSLPPQLLFVHAGSKLVKECHWHPQIPSMVMSTALSGYSVFVPSNL